VKTKDIEVDNLSLETIGQWPLLLKNSLFIGLGIMLLFLGFVLVLKDRWTELSTTRSQRQEAQHHYATSFHQAKNLEGYQHQVQEVQAMLANCSQQLPNKNEEAELLESISEQAHLSGLQFKAIKPLPEETKEFYIEHPFEILLMGTFHQLGEFVDRVSNIPRIVTLHEFSIQKDKSTANLEILLQAKAYWSPQTNIPKDNR